MNLISKSTLLFFALATLLLMSCGKDCTPPNVTENIVGTWEVSFSGGIVEFQSDGTLVDPNDEIIGGEVNGDVLTEKSYVATSDSLHTVAASATTTNRIEASFPIEKNECDKITVSLLGININLERQ